MAADLLPCPFCGGEAIAIQGFTDTVHVGCQTDGCLGSCGTGNRRLLFTRERWNKRAPSAAAPAAPATREADVAYNPDFIESVRLACLACFARRENNAQPIMFGHLQDAWDMMNMGTHLIATPPAAAPVLGFPLAPPGDPAYVAAPVEVTITDAAIAAGVREARLNFLRSWWELNERGEPSRQLYVFDDHYLRDAIQAALAAAASAGQKS